MTTKTLWDDTLPGRIEGDEPPEPAVHSRQKEPEISKDTGKPMLPFESMDEDYQRDTKEELGDPSARALEVYDTATISSVKDTFETFLPPDNLKALRRSGMLDSATFFEGLLKFEPELLEIEERYAAIRLSAPQNAEWKFQYGKEMEALAQRAVFEAEQAWIRRFGPLQRF